MAPTVWRHLHGAEFVTPNMLFYLLSRSGTLLDIGANVGQSTIGLLEVPDSHLICFEHFFIDHRKQVLPWSPFDIKTYLNNAIFIHRDDDWGLKRLDMIQAVLHAEKTDHH